MPVNLGAGLRVPGFQPYLNFLRDAVFLPFPTRAYRRPAEKVKCCVMLSLRLYKVQTCSCNKHVRPFLTTHTSAHLFSCFPLPSLSGRLLMLSWRCSTSCCGTTSPSRQTLSRRWWSCRVSRSRPTSRQATASCSTCSTTRPCWRSASACWRRVYASWTPMHPSLVREHTLLLSEKESSLVCVCCDDMLRLSLQVRSTWSRQCYTACACWT